MKGLFFVRFGVILLLLTSCLKEEEPQQGKTVLEFSVEQTQAKVAPGNNDGASITLLWEAGDNINVNGHESETLTQGGTGKASFTFAGKLDSPYNAIYPASAVVSTENAAAHVNLPSTQNSSEGKFDRNACILIGKGSQKDISLSHAMAYIAFVFEKGSVDAVLSSLEITAAGGEKISGGFTTDYATLSAKGDASSTVTVTAGAAVGSGTAITVAIPAQNYQNGFSLTVKDTEGRTMSKRTEGRFNAAAGHFYTTVLTYLPDVDYPEYLYIAGDAVEWGWNPEDSRAAIPEAENGIYRADITFDFGEDGGKGFKFWETSDWGTEYGMTSDSEFGNIGIDLISSIGGDPQFYLGQKGYQSGEYTITVDLNTKKVTLLSAGVPETLYMAGGFNEWISLVPMEKIADGRFQVTDYEFNFFNSDSDPKGHGIKFFESSDWTGEWGSKENWETGDYRGWELASYAEGAPQFYPQLAGFESGTYTVLVDFETMTVTLKSSSDEPEPEPEPEYPETLYMSGGFNGWSPVQLEKIAEGKFRIEDYEFDFFSSEEDVKGHGIKFFENIEDWSNQWGPKENWENTEYRGWELAPYADAPQFYPLLAGLESGTYTVLVDFTAMTVSLTSENDEPDVPVNLPSTIYIAGDPFEWKWEYPERIDGVNGVFEIRCSLNFTFDKAPYDGFKLFGADAEGYIDWNVIYGMRPGSTKNNISFDLVSNIGGDPQFYLKNLGYDSGNYILTFNFSTMKLTVTESDEPVTSKLLSDKNATEQTENLYANMMELVETGTMFGVQMPTTQGINFSSSWTAGANSTNRSDTKDLTGSHPAVCGWEIGGIEYGWANNLDGVSFETIRAHIIAAYNRGAVNTISWHCHNPVTDGRYNSASDNPISAILPGGSHHDKFCGWMDKAAEFLLSLKTSDGTLIPVIFRPWHEHTDRAQGSGFWWSVGNNSNDNYKLLWQMTFNYLTRTKGVHNLIWAYSPDLHHLCWNESGLDKYVYMNAWPGDAYVDILGLDAYQTSYSNFDASVANVVNHALSLAEEKGKLFAITETGLSNNNPGHYKYYYNEKWWTEKLYPLLSGKKVSYAMAWRNDGYPTDGQYPEYYNAFPGCYSANDFLVFAGKGDILLEDDIDNMYK